MNYSISRYIIPCVVLMAGGLLPSISATAQTVVSFSDRALDGLVRWALDKGPEDVILDSDMAELTALVDIFPGGERIRHLDGLESASNLTLLALEDNLLEDLSPLAGLTQLQELYVSENRISDLTPLAELTALRIVIANDNRISDISPLANLTALTVLRLNENAIQNLEGLTNLEQLTYLGLQDNRVSDVGPLEGLAQLEEVNAGDNEIVDLAPLLNNAQAGVLERIYVGHNLLDATAVCTIIPELDALGVYVGYLMEVIPTPYPRPDLSIVCDDPMGDRDQDGLSNLDEVNFGTSMDVADSDSDGYLDGAEVAAGSDPIDDGAFPGAVPVIIPDPDLESAVRNDLERYRGELFVHHLESLTTLFASDRDIVSLEGIEYAANLEVLHLGGNRIGDVSPLKGLGKLRTLDLSDNGIRDAAPIAELKRIRSLHGLDLSGNAIVDVEPIAELEGLNSLTLHDNRIEDGAPLGRMKALVSLGLNQNPLQSIDFIRELNPLVILRLSGVGCSDISAIAAHPGLQILELADNGIVDISPLEGLYLSERLDLRNNRIRDIRPLRNKFLLARLELDGNEIFNPGPLVTLQTLRGLSIADNNITGANAIGALGRLTSINLRANELRDGGFVRGLRNSWRLDLSKNRLSVLPPVNALSELRELDLSDNELSIMASLDVPFVDESLDLSGNQFTEIPSPLDTNLAVAVVDLARNAVPLDTICAYVNQAFAGSDPTTLPDETVRLLELCADPDADTDMDGLGAYDEFLAGSDPDVADTDEDGFSDGEEVEAGTYPYLADSYPIEHPSTMAPGEMAEVLLGQFETLHSGGTGYRLEYGECQQAIDGLTYAQFEVLDANQSGGLSELELEKALTAAAGCNLEMDRAKQAFHDNKSDLAVLGLALMTLVIMGRRGGSI